MKGRYLFILGIVFLIASLVIQVGFSAPENIFSADESYQVELSDLKKRGACDSTKYTVTNLESSITIQTSHYFTNNDGVQVYVFASSIGPGETQTYDLASMDDLPKYFRGDVLVTSAGEISGNKLFFPPCGISIEGPSFGNTKIDTSYTFTATVTPEDALLPITYTWYEYGKPPIIHTNGIRDSVELSWTKSGLKQIFLYVENAVGSVNIRILVFIDAGFGRIYIPITIR